MDKPKEGVDNVMALHDIPDAWNSVNQAFGLTHGATAANQAMHLAGNASAMGNATAAERFTEFAEHSRGGLNAVMENPAMKVGGNVLGCVLGGLNIAKGVGEWGKGDKTQGAMDMVAGGTGVAASALGLGLGGAALAPVAAVAAPVAVAAGLAAAGNDWTRKQGWWGKNADGSNRDSLQFVGQNTSNAYSSVNKWAGGGVKGAIAGGLAGAGTALGTGALALGGDLVGGVAAVGQGLGSLGAAAGKGLWSGAKAVGGGLASGAKAIGSGIGSAAKSVGNFVSHLW
ncbi:MAG: hypothetical protein ACM31C_08940 [Acidobacteriota bacterium]